ncbi:MAG: YybH family protein [Caulobacterales bacterium]
MKTTKLSAAALGVIAAASLAACKPPADTAKVADAVKADVAQLTSDYNAHDAAKVASHDAADVVQMGHGGPNVVGKAADLAANTLLFAGDPTTHVTLTGQTVDVAASGDMAVLRASYAVGFTDPKIKQPATETGNYLAGYKLQSDGTWKLQWSVISDTGPATAAPGPTVGSG